MELENIKSQIEEATLDATSTTDPFAELDLLIERADELGVLPLVLSVTEGAILGEGVHPAHYYLYASAQFRKGNADAAYKAVIPLGGRLESEGHWQALGQLSGKALENAPRVEAALFLAKSLESAGLDLLDPALLRKAYDNFPSESRIAYLMGDLRYAEAEKLKDADPDEIKRLMMEARFFWAESLEGFIAHKKNDAIESVIVKLKDDQHPGTLKRVIASMKKMADSSQWGRFQSALENLLPAFEKAGLLSEIWRLLLAHIADAPAGVAVRQHLSDLAPKAFPHAEGLEEMLTRTGILDTDTPVDAAMKQLEPLMAFLPGCHVLHASWGVGRVLRNDGESLIIDFEETQGHRMSVNLARRALEVIPTDDLRVMSIEQPDEVKTMVKSSPAEVAYLGIRQLRGQARTQDLKRSLLAANVMAPSRWTTFWKDAKAAMENDVRFDLSQAFRQVYKIRTGSDSGGEVDFPVIEPRRGVRPNLNLIKRFLEQHPKEMARSARLYTMILERWAKEEKTNAEDRMAIHFQLYRWRQETNQDFHDALRDMLQQGVEASSFSDIEDQKLLTRVGLDYDDLWKETACFALSSRYLDVRQMALDKLNSDPDVGHGLFRELIQNPADRPMAALAAMNLAVRPNEDGSIAPGPWEASLGAATLIESTTREQVRKLALTMLAPEGLLAAKLAQTEPPDTIQERWGFLLRKWRSSERYLQPVLKVLRQSGLDSVVDDFRSEQMEKTNRALGSQEAVDYSGTLMTRLTFERLKKDLERLNFELKTTVAQAIQKARELGDLRENAEYEAAKQKQADHMERLGSLQNRLESARMIEDLQFPDNEVGPGVVVTIQDTHSQAYESYWLLGEGDDVFGDDVLSYASPLGRELLGKKIGERISVIRNEGVKEYVVLTTTPKLPEGDATAASSEQTTTS